jgi:hypothetical protein
MRLNTLMGIRSKYADPLGNMARNNDDGLCSRHCSRTPGSSLATALLTVSAGCSSSRLCFTPPAPLLLLLFSRCQLVVLVLAFVLAPPAPLLQCVFAQCQMIAPNSSLQDWHALLLDKEPWFDSSPGSSLAAAHGADS